jgi:hypothetical protein
MRSGHLRLAHRWFTRKAIDVNVDPIGVTGEPAPAM